MRAAQWALLVCLLAALLTGEVSAGKRNKKPKDVKAVGKEERASKARAKSEARSRFEKMYPIVFDEYARVLQWARDVVKIDCEKDKAQNFKCVWGWRCLYVGSALSSQSLDFFLPFFLSSFLPCD